MKLRKSHSIFSKHDYSFSFTFASATTLFLKSIIYIDITRF